MTKDKVLVDYIIRKLNLHLQNIANNGYGHNGNGNGNGSEFKFDLGEATARERKFAYDLIDWAKNFLNGAEADLGMTPQGFVWGMVNYILSDDCDDGWWAANMQSLLQIYNKKNRIAWSYWEKEARLRGVETPRSAATKARLKVLAEDLNKISF